MNVNGAYEVMYKHPNSTINKKTGLASLDYFEGRCENFSAGGLCAFKNDSDEFLLVHYKDIVQMKLIN